MNVLIICAGRTKTYISEGRYNRSLAEVARDTLSPPHQVTISYVEDGYDREQEQQKYLAADVIIFQFPVFWFGPPAPLKAYMDDVYRRKVFYDRAPTYGRGGLLTGKRFLLSSTWNAPAAAFNDKSAFFEGHSVDQALFALRKAHEYLGMTALPSFSVHDVIVNPDFEANAERFRQHLGRVLPD